MNILHIIDVSNPNGNGVAVAVKNYLEYESHLVNVALYYLNAEIEINGINTYSYKNIKKIEELPKPFCKPDLVIFNEVYKPKYIKLYKECLKRKIKYIIIPHGCLVKEAQKKSRLKKIIGNTLLFNRFIYKANAIQFLNENEKNNSEFKFKKAIIAGNGVERPSYKNESNHKNKDLIFIGRYEIKHKGLDLLVGICDKYHEWFINNNVKIQLYGRDSMNNLSIFNNMIAEKEVGDILIVNKPVYNEEKKTILKKAYAFIQCSRFEGQPMGIIEALSVGVPCIVTYGTFLGDYIRDNECGIACDFNEEEIFAAISNLVKDDKKRDLCAKNSYNRSNIDFNWDNVIIKTIKEYKRIKG